MSQSETVSNFRDRGFSNSPQPIDAIGRRERAADVVLAKTSTDRVDLIERLPVGIMKRCDFAITHIARKRPGHGMTDIGVKSASYAACVHLEQFAGCDIWRDGRSERIGTLQVGMAHISDMRHSWQADIPSPFDVVNFCIPESALDEVTEDLRIPKILELRCPIGAARTDTVMTNFGLALLPALHNANQTNQLFVDHAALAITVHLVNTYGISQTRKLGYHGGLASWQERRAKEIVRAKLAGDISLKELASSCGLSPSHFGRAFKQSVGCAPYQWLIKQRVELAKQLILNTNEPLCQIALATGFVNQSHFTRVFSQHTKASPAAWRRDQVRSQAIKVGY